MIIWGNCKLLKGPFLARPIEVPDEMRRDLDVLYNPQHVPVIRRTNPLIDHYKGVTYAETV